MKLVVLVLFVIASAAAVNNDKIENLPGLTEEINFNQVCIACNLIIISTLDILQLMLLMIGNSSIGNVS